MMIGIHPEIPEPYLEPERRLELMPESFIATLPVMVWP